MSVVRIDEALDAAGCADELPEGASSGPIY